MTSDPIARVFELLKTHKYLQLSANWCPDCRYANSVWEKLNIQNKIYVFDIAAFSKIEQEKWRSAFQEVTGSRNLPSIYYNGRLWGTEVQLHTLENDGTLIEELRKIGLF